MVPQCLSGKMSWWQNAEVPKCHVAKILWCQKNKRCQNVVLPKCCVAEMLCCRNVVLQNVVLPKCCVAKMSDCQNVVLPNCRAAIMTVADLSFSKLSIAILSVNPPLRLVQSWTSTTQVVVAFVAGKSVLSMTASMLKQSSYWHQWV